MITVPPLRNALVAAAMALVGAVAHAETFTFNALLAGAGPDPVDVATITVTESGDDLLFSLSAAGLDQLGDGAFLGAIAVEGLQQGSIAGVLGDAPVKISNGGGPGGEFTFRFDLTGPKQARLTDDESVSWVWKGASQSLGSLVFAAHVQNVTPAGPGADTSLWYSVGTAPVPEPETYSLMLAGLGVAAFMARRRRLG